MIHAITVKKAELLAALRKQPQHNVNVTGRERTDAGFKVAEGLANYPAALREQCPKLSSVCHISIAVDKATLAHPLQKFFQAVKVSVRAACIAFRLVHAAESSKRTN